MTLLRRTAPPARTTVRQAELFAATMSFTEFSRPFTEKGAPNPAGCASFAGRRGRRARSSPWCAFRAATAALIVAADQLREHPVEPGDPRAHRPHRIVVDEVLERHGDALAIFVEPLERGFQ